jgi:hypothetical protein
VGESTGPGGSADEFERRGKVIECLQWVCYELAMNSMLSDAWFMKRIERVLAERDG